MGKLMRFMMQRVLPALLLLCLSGFTTTSLADKHKPMVYMKTDLGEVVFELYPEKAPATVANFLQYCRDGFYPGTIFHRVVPGFVVQGGGYTFDYVKKETRDPVKNESDNGLLNLEGTVAMARLKDPDSATSQFYFNLKDNKHLDPVNKQAGYTVFGKLVRGHDVLLEITREPLGKYRPQAPDLPVRILAIRVEP